MNERSRVVVIGGGIGGLVAARELAGRGHDVTVLEASASVGGLVEGFDLGGAGLERYYHYVLPQESRILGLIDELGLGDRVEWFPGSIGILSGGKVWPFTSPLDLLRFEPLAFHERLRAGIGALRLGRVRNWPELDEVPALDWLTGLTSPAVTDVVWNPLLRAKFGPAAGDVPAAWMWARLDQRRQARKGTGEVVGYLRGGFSLLFEALADEVHRRGAEIRTSTRAERFVVESGRVTAVETTGGVVPAEVVLFAGALPQLVPLVPPELVDPRWSAARGLGAMCVVLELRRSVTPVFWTNVCDRDLPFGGIIEHTNLVPTSWYGGRHVVYLSRYFTHDEPITSSDVEGETARWLDALHAAFPDVTPSDIVNVHSFRAAYAAPLVSTPYVPAIPPARSHIDGLYLATTAQIYPQDRGMDAGIVRAQATVDAIADGGWSCPVCDGRHHQPAFEATTSGTEGGVDAAAFRPSSDEYGQLTATVVRCIGCGHCSVVEAPDEESVAAAYGDAVDDVTLREAPGQRATADRALARIEAEVRPGRLLDVGCWTGSFLEAAATRGWTVTGIEPSKWASSEAQRRGSTVHNAAFEDVALEPESFDLIVSCDVVEHLADPASAVERMAGLLRPGGAVYLTVPDAGSRLARLMGRRWWAIVPMHLQYFTRSSMRLLLSRHGLEVRHVATHPKSFSLRYYAERMAGFVPGVGPLALRLVDRSRHADRVVAPDFGDRMEVIAVKSR